jgi:hypothetical protein
MVVRPDSPREAYFDRSGRKIKEGRPPPVIGLPPGLRAAFGIPTESQRRAEEFTASEIATACLELHSGSTVIGIQITVDATYSQSAGYRILRVSFSGDFITQPQIMQWQVMEGHIGNGAFFLWAQQVPPTNAPPHLEMAVGSYAQNILILGFSKDPSTYPGIYGFDGSIFDFPHHTTLFKGWEACS